MYFEIHNTVPCLNSLKHIIPPGEGTETFQKSAPQGEVSENQTPPPPGPTPTQCVDFAPARERGKGDEWKGVMGGRWQ